MSKAKRERERESQKVAKIYDRKDVICLDFGAW